MSDVTEVIQGDFHKMPFADNSFDAIFSVEATCHASSVRSHLSHDLTCGTLLSSAAYLCLHVTVSPNARAGMRA